MCFGFGIAAQLKVIGCIYLLLLSFSDYFNTYFLDTTLCKCSTSVYDYIIATDESGTGQEHDGDDEQEEEAEGEEEEEKNEEKNEEECNYKLRTF